jgi:LysR family transcriptional activator of nhaA
MNVLNYKHLHYFWVVAKTGSIARASERLHVTPQTISGQLSQFADALGDTLFERVGRRLELTDAGRLVLSYAEDIFVLGRDLQEALRDGSPGRGSQFKAGVADAMPKSVAYRLLEPALRLPRPQRIVCREGRLDALLADLAVHRLDLVLADRPMPTHLNVRGYSHLLGECGVSFFGTPALLRSHKGAFPACLDGAPMLLPGEDAVVRPRLMRWFERERIRPRIVGEFDDGALLKAFGQAGAGLFASPTAISAQVQRQFGVKAIGSTEAVTEQFYAISVQRLLTHPAVVAITSAARQKLFRGRPKGGSAVHGTACF